MTVLKTWRTHIRGQTAEPAPIVSIGLRLKLSRASNQKFATRKEQASSGYQTG
jgi:hypothetical protein